MPKTVSAPLLLATSVLSLSLLLVVPADAKAFKLGDEEAITWITVPDTWEPETFDNGVEGTSPDKETYVAAEVVDGKDLDEAGKDEDAFFAKQKITLKGGQRRSGRSRSTACPLTTSPGRRPTQMARPT